MSDEVAEVRKVVDECVHQVVTTLRQDLFSRRVVVTINPGVWANEAGIVTGYLSCYPRGDPSELSIDAVFSFSVVVGEAHYSVGIYWSDGSVIEDVLEGKISFTELGELLSQVKEVCRLAESELTIRLPNRIVKLKDKSPSQ